MSPLVAPLTYATKGDYKPSETDQHEAEKFIEGKFFNNLPTDPAKAQAELNRRMVEFEAYYRAQNSNGDDAVQPEKAKNLYYALGQFIAPYLHSAKRLTHLGVASTDDPYRTAAAAADGERIQAETQQILGITQEQSKKIERTTVRSKDGIMARIKHLGVLLIPTVGIFMGVGLGTAYEQQHSADNDAAPALSQPAAEPAPRVYDVTSNQTLTEYLSTELPAIIQDARRDPDIIEYRNAYQNSLRTYTNALASHNEHDISVARRRLYNNLPPHRYSYSSDYIINAPFLEDILPITREVALSIASHDAQIRSDYIQNQLWLSPEEKQNLVELMNRHQATLQLISEHEYDDYDMPLSDFLRPNLSRQSLTATQTAAFQIVFDILDWYFAWAERGQVAPPTQVAAPPQHVSSTQNYIQAAAASGTAGAALFLLLITAGYALDRKKGGVLRSELLNALAQGYADRCRNTGIQPDLRIIEDLKNGSMESVAQAIPMSSCEKSLIRARIETQAELASPTTEQSPQAEHQEVEYQEVTRQQHNAQEQGR